jgi:hypothetical protein
MRRNLGITPETQNLPFWLHKTGLKMCLKMIVLAGLNQLPEPVDEVALPSLLNIAIAATIFFPPKLMPRVVISASNSA